MADKRIHILPVDLAVAYGYTQDYAGRVLRRVKQEMELKDTAILTIKQYCDHVDIDLNDFLTAINVELPNSPKK